MSRHLWSDRLATVILTAWRHTGMAEQVPAVCDVLDTIEQRNWERLRRLLHPEVHWTTAVEEHLIGPAAVVDCLSGDPPPAPPAFHELRDGRIIRWIDTPG